MSPGEKSEAQKAKELERAEREKRDNARFINMAALVVSIVVPVWGICTIPTLIQWSNPKLKLEIDNFALANSLFSALAFAGVIAAIYLQTRELQYQRQELEDTRDELKNSVDAQRQSATAQTKAVEAQNNLVKLQAITALLSSSQYELELDKEGTIAKEYHEKIGAGFGDLTNNLYHRSKLYYAELERIYDEIADNKAFDFPQLHQKYLMRAKWFEDIDEHARNIDDAMQTLRLVNDFPSSELYGENLSDAVHFVGQTVLNMIASTGLRARHLFTSQNTQDYSEIASKLMSLGRLLVLKRDTAMMDSTVKAFKEFKQFIYIKRFRR